MFLGRKNQQCENDYTTKHNLQIQCDPYQIMNGTFHRSRRKKFTIHMETQMTPVETTQQEGFPKVGYGKRMRNETQEFREKQGSGGQHRSKVKVPKLNPSQLYYTFGRE